MKITEINDVKKILVLQLGGIGDVVLSVPALKALRAKFKEANISLLVLSRSTDLIRGCAFIDDLYALDIHYTDLRSLFRKRVFTVFYKLIKELRGKKFDLAINLESIGSLGGAIKMAIFLWLIAARYALGRDTQGRGVFFNFKMEEKDNSPKHELKANLDVVRILGADTFDMKIDLPVFEEDKKFAADFLAGCGVSERDLVIGLNPGAFRLSRRWPREYWIDLASRLVKKYNCKIIVTGHKSEEDIVGKIHGSPDTGNIISVTDLSLKQLVVLIKRFNLFITNDSGPMHIAAAMNVPLIALFGPGDVHKFSPDYGYNNCLVLRKDVGCKRPCYKFNCLPQECLKLITVEDVMQAVKTVMK